MDVLEQALPFRIRVLEGELSQAVIQDGQQPGVLILQGSELPYQPITYGTTHRMKTSFYVGNPVGTQQKMGPTLKPTKINGCWKDIRLGGGRARRLMEVLDDLCARGVELEVSWGDRVDLTGDVGGTPIVRIGAISDTLFTIDRPQDVRWELEFTWRARGDATASAPVLGIASPRLGFADAIDSLNDADGVTGSFLENLAVTLFGLSDSVFESLEKAQKDIETSADSIDLANSVIIANEGIATSVFESLISSASLGLDALQRLSDTVLALRISDLVPTDADALGLLKMQDQIFSLLQISLESQDTMIATRDSAQAQVTPDILAEVRVSAGTDLRDLALKYYDDPDSWWAIAQYNNFPSSEVPAPPSTTRTDDPGLPVLIPRLLPGASSDLRAAC